MDLTFFFQQKGEETFHFPFIIKDSITFVFNKYNLEPVTLMTIKKRNNQLYNKIKMIFTAIADNAKCVKLT